MGSLLYYFVIRFVGFWEKIFVGFHDTLPLLISGWGVVLWYVYLLFRMIINCNNI